MSLKVGYIVHDLADAAVAKRCEMMQRGGADVMLAGFRRGSALAEVYGIPVHDLGRTADRALGQRAMAVLRNVALPEKAKVATKGADILIARNLESLAIAQRISQGRPIVYECLDIHRSLLGTSRAERGIQKAEEKLLSSVSAIVTSSPAFVSEYFSQRPTGDAEIRLVENKILLNAGQLPEDVPPPPPLEGPPWVIGWFGMLRCKRTFAVLSKVASDLQGQVRILIAGKPSPAELPGFSAQVEAAPYCEFLGPYHPEELSELYARCHFAWAIDWFEEGQNSEWLLPNRLYESTAFGSVPIVLERHEVGRWLAKRDAGLQIRDPSNLRSVFAELNSDGYNQLREGIDAIEREAIMMGDSECREFVSWLQGMT